MMQALGRAACIWSGVWLIGAAAAAQTADPAKPPKDPIGSWADGIGLSVRKAFDGTKAEKSPATFLWVRDFAGADKEYSLIDLAMKIGERDLVPKSPSMLLVYPVGEYHRQTQESKRVNTAALGLKAEFRPIAPGIQPPGGSPPFPGAGTGPLVVPLFIGEAKIGRDFEAGKTNQLYSVFVMPFSTRPYWPGSDFRDRAHVFRGRYYPYAGVEYYRADVGTSSQRVEFGVARLYAEWWPVSSLERQVVQLTGEGTYRRHLSGHLFDGNASEISFGANVYVDGHGHLGFGIDYVRGEDPNQAFAFRERTTAGIKILL
jgi:hypothetical protein